MADKIKAIIHPQFDVQLQTVDKLLWKTDMAQVASLYYDITYPSYIYSYIHWLPSASLSQSAALYTLAQLTNM